jgi:hypothetical protein
MGSDKHNHVCYFEFSFPHDAGYLEYLNYRCYIFVEIIKPNKSSLCFLELHRRSLLFLHVLKKIGSYNIYIAAILAYMERNTFYKYKL